MLLIHQTMRHCGQHALKLEQEVLTGRLPVLQLAMSMATIISLILSSVKTTV